MSFRFVPRSAVYGQNIAEDSVPSRTAQARSMPTARALPLRTGAGPRVHQGAMPDAHQVELLKGEVVRLRQDRDRIVKEANAKLGALVGRVKQLEGYMRTAYAPGVQVPGRGQVDVGVPTHTLRNPYLYSVEGAKGAPPARMDPAHAGNPRDAAGAPGDTAHDAHETVRAAEDALFYGEGDAVFYQGDD